MTTLNVNFINPFIDGTLNTFKIQCAVEASPGKPFMKGNGPTLTAEIAATIGLASKEFCGSVSIGFSESLFLALMGNMLGEKYTEITKDLEDGASELLNIIFGQAKTVLNEKGYAIDKAIPTVIRGKGISFNHLSSQPTLVVPFETQHGPFFIEVVLEGQRN